MIPNVPPSQTWEALKDNPQACLIDVRTQAEWAFVGVPDLSPVGKELVLIPWQIYPDMRVNDAFAEHLQRNGLTKEHHLYFICRSGVRSLAAANLAQQAGFPHVYNVADGFEGPMDTQRHRGCVAGWKADALPWRQS